MHKKIDLLLIAFLLILSIFFISSHIAPGSTDAYWHLAVGRQVWQEKKVVQEDKFIYGSQNHYFTSVEWLSGLITYALVKTASVNSIYVLRVSIGLAILLIVYSTNQLFNLKKSLNYAAILLLAYVLPSRLSLDRPENFSLLFVAAINFFGFYYLTRRKITYFFLTLPVIFLLWPNLHVYVPIGIFLLVAWLLIYFLSFLEDHTKIAELRSISIIVSLSALMAVIQFRRFIFFLFTPSFAKFSVGEQVSIFSRLNEIKINFLNQVPFEIYVYFFVSVVFFIISTIFILKKNFKLSNLCVLLMGAFITILPAIYFRLIALESILVIPVALYLLSLTGLKDKTVTYISNSVLAFLTFIILISIFIGHPLGWRQYWRYYQNNQGDYIGVRNFSWTAQFPKSISENINKNLYSKRIITSKIWSNYLIWMLPGVKTFSDAQWTFRTEDDFKDEQNLNGGTNNWEELLKKYNIDTVVNSQYDSIIDNFTPVYQLPNWKLAYVDSNAVIYARNDVIKNLPVNLSKIHPEQAYIPFNLSFDPKDEEAANQLRALLRYDDKNSFARSQLILYEMNYQNDLENAKKLTLESKLLIPQDPIFSYFMTAIYARENKCDLALSFAKEMKQKSFGDINFSQAANTELAKCQKAI